jgi:alpha-N-arabinofuranosidase
MRPEYYADEYRRYATFVKNYSANRIQRIASGANAGDYNWTEVLMSQVGARMQGLSVHYYTLPTGDWKKKGSATQFGEDQWHSTLMRTLRMEELLQKHSAIMDKYDPEKRIGLMVDEWGTWYDPEPGPRPSALYQQNSLRDAIVAGINLNIFHQHADRVQMANIAQTVNVLQAVILTDKEKMILTPTYYVFEMYKTHQGATLIPVELSAPEYRHEQSAVPALHASASRDKAGKLHLSIVNLDPNRPGLVSTKIVGASAKNITGRVLTAPAMNTVNTFDKPEAVRPAPFTGIQIQGDLITLSLPSKSVVVLEIQ